MGLLIGQVLVFDNFSLFGVATAHVFLVFLLMLPLSMRFPLVLLVAFTAGLLVDLFSSNQLIGLHAFSCVLMMSLRRSWVEIVTIRQAFKENEDTFLYFQPVQWYVNYLAPLILVHHIAFYLLEAFTFQHFGKTLLQIVFSSIFSFVLILASTMFIYNQSARK